MMEKLDEVKIAITNHRKEFPGRRHFPKGIWNKIMLLAEEIPPRILAEKIGIDANNLMRRIKGSSEKKTKFVELPKPLKKGKIILNLPHNISLRIEL